MKHNKLIVIVSNKKGDCYQVALTKEQTETVTALITQMHGGKIMAIETKLLMEIGSKL